MKSLLIMTFAFGLAMAATSSRGEAPAQATSTEAAPTEAVPTEATPEPRPMTVEDLWAMDRLGGPAVSPDGRWVAFTVTRFSTEENKGEGDLWLVPSDGSAAPRRLTWNKGSDGSPAWSPDSRSLVFVSKRGEGPPQLYRLPMEGGEAEPLTELPVGVRSPKWFADGKRIAFVASTFPDLDGDFEKIKERVDERKEDKTGAKISDTHVLRYWDHYLTDGTVPHIFVLDLESGEVRDVTPDFDLLAGFGGFDWDLAPDGKEVAFAANSSAPPYRKLDFNVFVLSLESGEMKPLTADNPAFDGGPVYTPDGRYLLFARTHRPDVAPDQGILARYDRASGEIVELTDTWDYEPSGWVVTADSRTILFHASDNGRRNLFALPVAGGTPRLLVRGGATAGVAVGGDRAIYLHESLNQPPELMAVTLDGAAPQALTAFNAERLAALEFGEVEDLTFEGADGNAVQMFVVHPPGFDASKSWPLLMLIHGGPHGAFSDSFHFRWNGSLFAAPGHVVAMVNFHGSTGFGQAFAESILGAHADKPFTDVMKATDLLAARPYIDAERMAAAGGSYGGYLVSWILGHTDRYKALINHAGVYDLMAQFASDYTWSRGNNYGAEPWEDPVRIDRWSPSRFAANFNTPTLILHGEKDYRVPYTQGINLHHVLSGKGVPSRIVIFPDENHWILKPQAAKLWWDEVFAWLDKYIGSGPRER